MNERTRLMFAFAVGLAIGAVLPTVVPAVAEAGRPLVKALIKHGMLGVERLRTATARASEWVEDLVAEARAEVADTLSPLTGDGGTDGGDAEPVRAEPAAADLGGRPNLKVMS